MSTQHDPEAEALRAKIVQAIQTQGFFIMGVAGDAPHECYLHTIGLSPAHPELIIVAQPPDQVMPLLNWLALQEKNEQTIFEPGRNYDDILETGPCRCEWVARKYYEEYVGVAVRWW